MSKVINSLEEGMIAFLLGAMTIVTFSQVVARYVFNTGAVWALELTVYLFAWLVLFGMSYGVKVGIHLGVDAFVNLFPSRVQRVLTLAAALACIAYAAILLVGAWDYWSKIHRFGIATEDLYVPRVIVEALHPGEEYEEVGIPRSVPYSILPLGLALLLFRFLQATWDVITRKRAHIIASHEAEDMVRQAQREGEARPHDREAAGPEAPDQPEPGSRARPDREG